MPRKKKEEDPVSTLAKCIVLLDDLRAYRRKDVEQVDQVFSDLKKTRFRDHYDMWVKTRPYAEKIVDMPFKIEGVKKMIQKLAWLKVANRIFLIVLVIFIAILLVPVWRNMLGPEPLGGNAFLYATIAVVLVVGSMNISAFIDYRIRKKIIAYERETMGEYALARDKMKEGVNKMLRSLAKEAHRKGVNPIEYSIVLYFDDYDGIEVIKQWRPRAIGIFKKSYSHFQVVPKL